MDTSWLAPVAILALGVGINSFFLWRLWSHYNRLTGRVSKKELIAALNQLLKEVGHNGKQISELDKKLADYKQWNESGLRKLEFKRYNPFADTGGNQSFCLAILNANNSGFMISSLHSRENTRLYAKLITNGKSVDQNLSKEEQEVLNQAVKK